MFGSRLYQRRIDEVHAFLYFLYLLYFFYLFLLIIINYYYYMMIIIWNSLYNYVVSVDFYICSICLSKCLYFTVSEPYCLFLYTLTDSLACSFQLAFFLFFSLLPSLNTHAHLFHSFISFVHWFVHSFVRSSQYSSIHPFIHSSVHLSF